MTISILLDLQQLALTSAIRGLVDHRQGHVPESIAGWPVLSPADIADLDVNLLIVGLDEEKEGVHQCVRSLALRGLEGDVAEFGVYKAGTTTFLARCLREFGHGGTVYGFDTFSGFPPARSVLDAHGDPADEYFNERAVHAHCALHSNIRLIRGDIAETYGILAERKLILTFFDTDNYSATRAALPLCVELTVPGGVIAFDHYYSPGWPTTLGERIAAKEVLTSTSWLNLHGTGIFFKVG